MFVLNFRLDLVYSFGDSAILYFGVFSLRLSHAHFRGFWGTFPQWHKWRHLPSS